MSAIVAFDMTVDDVMDRMEEIRLIAVFKPADSEYMLAELMEEILRAIADGTDNPYDLAYTFFQELEKGVNDEENS